MNVDLGQSSLDKCVLQVQKASGFSFAYETSGLHSIAVAPRSFKNEKLYVILSYLLEGTGYVFEERHNVIVIGPSEGWSGRSDSAHLFRGVIEDRETGLKLEGVAVYDQKSRNIGTFTNKEGYFSLTSVSDTLKLRLSYLSYKPVEILLNAADAPLVRIKMNVAQEGLDSVLVIHPEDIAPISVLSKVTPLSKQMSFLPKFCGDIDLISVLKTTPGIQEAKDGSGTFIVRGGAPDQNLLLLDGANIYGATHLFGILSSINANTIKDISIYKGAFPARFGGRISSVWDITLKDGDPERYHGVFSLGTLASDFMLEGPLVKNKTTFMIAARRSYHDLYLRLSEPGLIFYFQDLNLKLHHHFSEKDDLYFTGYYSRDRFRQEHKDIREYDMVMGQTTMLNTENYAAVLRWRHSYSGHLMSNLSLLYSAYHLSTATKITQSESPGDSLPVFKISLDDKIKTGLYDLTAKFNLKYTPGSIHDIEAGVYYTRHTFKPDIISSEATLFDGQDEYIAQNIRTIRDTASNEIGLYLQDNLNLSDRLKAEIGFHVNQFTNTRKAYFSFQPRISISYRLSKSWFLNTSYVRMQQNLHRLTISQTSLPLDFWIPSTAFLKPQSAHQWSVGLSGKLADGLLSLSVESYYKIMNNVVEYLIINANDTIYDENIRWDKEVATGSGKAYGIECSLQKSKGNFNGWLNYALSWSNRKLPEVNGGNPFPYKYDRRHNLNLVALYKLSKALELSAVFTFQSRPQVPVLIIRTTDTSLYPIDLRKAATDSDLRAYHRLDLGISWIKEQKNGAIRIWNLSVFNVYNRKNAFFYLQSDTQNGKDLSGNSLLPFSGALSYTLKF